MHCRTGRSGLTNDVGASGSGSTGGSASGVRQLVKQQSQAKRGFVKARGIVDTNSLVREYNGCQEESQSFLFQWLQKYHSAFGESGGGSVEKGVALEYATLAKIKLQPHSTEEEELLMTLFDDLAAKTTKTSLEKENARALHQVLFHVDPSVFAKDAEKLMDVSNALVQNCLEIGNELNKDTFPEYGAPLLALHQALQLLEKLDDFETTKDRKLTILKEFREKADALNVAEGFYPFTFWVQRIEQAITHLKDGGRQSLKSWLTFLYRITCGIANCWHGFRPLLTFDIDPAAIRQGAGELKAAVFQLPKGMRWYSCVQVLSDTIKQTIGNTGEPEKLQAAYHTVIEHLNDPNNAKNVRDLKALVFGTLDELFCAAISDFDTQSRQFAFESLMELVDVDKHSDGQKDFVKQFMKDESFLNTILNMVGFLGTRETFKEEAVRVLQNLVSVEDSGIHAVLTGWLGNYNSPQEKIEEDVKLKQLVPASTTNFLFLLVEKQLDWAMPSEEREKCIKALKRRFQQPGFMQVHPADELI